MPTKTCELAILANQSKSRGTFSVDSWRPGARAAASLAGRSLTSLALSAHLLAPALGPVCEHACDRARGLVAGRGQRPAPARARFAGRCTGIKKMASTGGAGTCGGAAGRRQALWPDDVQYVQNGVVGKRRRDRNRVKAPPEAIAPGKPPRPINDSESRCFCSRTAGSSPENGNDVGAFTIILARP